MKKLLSLSLLLFTYGAVAAQSETSFDLPVGNDSLNVYATPQSTGLMDRISHCYVPTSIDSVSSPFVFQHGGYNADFVILPLNGSNPLYWGNVQLAGAMNREQYPGLMNKASGSLGLQYNHSRLSAYAGGVINKYASYQGLFTQKGVTANLSYGFSPRLSATLFGTYYWGNGLRMANGMPMSPAMLGYYEVSRFGGYADYHNETFGIQTGAQVVERVGMSPRYEVEPIVTPYISVGKGKKKFGLGLPVGQILYGIFHR